MKNLAIVTASIFGSESLDKNGKQAIFLSPVVGAIPNRNVISGTIAERKGIEAGKSYLVSITEKETDPKFGRQFDFQKVSNVTVMDILQAQAELGPGSIYDAGVTVDSEVKETV